MELLITYGDPIVSSLMNKMKCSRQTNPLLLHAFCHSVYVMEEHNLHDIIRSLKISHKICSTIPKSSNII